MLCYMLSLEPDIPGIVVIEIAEDQLSKTTYIGSSIG